MLTRNNNYYVYLLLAGYILYLFMMPIRLGDTDMWYHLNGGRFFWENLSIPTTTFYSYIDPIREWTNYYWGFQAIIYKVYEISGYHGLAVLRSVIGSATVVMFFALFAHQRNDRNTLLLFLLLASFIIIYDGRVYQLRPHLFSYFFITVFFYILQYKPRLAPALPILTVPWANIHGVEWPIPAIICGGYALTVILKLIQNRETGIDNPRLYIVSILLCAPAFLINPYGWKLFLAPFNIDHDTYKYIAELTPLDTKAISTFQINGIVVPLHTAMTVLMIISTWGAISLFFRKKLPVYASILYIAGLYLLFRGSRFVWEWLLLTLPVLTHFINNPSRSIFKISSEKASFHAVLLITLLLTAGTVYEKSRQFGAYPFDNRRLPTGLRDFVDKSDASGRIIAHPSLAGYIEWALHPRIKTFIDMQFPPSTDLDIFKLTRAYHNEYGLRKFVEEHDIDWIVSQPGTQPITGNIQKLESFKPVFMDDALVLYANSNIHNQLVNQYELTAFDVNKPLNVPENRESEYLDDLHRLLEITPDLAFANQALATYHLGKQNNKQALIHALEFVRISPFDANSHYLLGRTYQQLEQFDKSIQSLNKAYRLTNPDSHAKVEIALASTYYFAEDFSSAYKLFQKSVNPYRLIHEPDTLYMYALSATISGELEDALKMIEMLLYSTEENKHLDIIEQARGIRAKIENGDFDSISFIEWIFSKITGD